MLGREVIGCNNGAIKLIRFVRGDTGWGYRDWRCAGGRCLVQTDFEGANCMKKIKESLDPSYMNLFMESLNDILRSKTRPNIWLRFLDDIFLL
jgi:hypothetical protein